MALTDFLQDSSLGSWADEMDSLPTAPAARTDDDRSRGRGDRDYGGRGFDDYPPRESRYPPREELPLPTAPPYTAFIGNLAFDLRERDVEQFFSVPLKSVKIIKDREDKPKGFGYVEFESLQDLKDGLAKSGTQLASRTVRISVAEPQKEREDDKFSAPWRRDGPLPSHDRGPAARGPSRFDSAPDRGERMGFGSRFVPSTDGPRGGPSRGEPAGPTEAETNSDWRAGARPARAPPTPERPGPPSRKISGFSSQDGPAHAADTEDTWAKGSRFTPSESSGPSGGTQKSSFFGKRDGGFRGSEEDPGDWRSPRKQAPANGRHGSFDRSTSESVPSTPNMGRRKLELLPRTSSQSTATSPVGSPKSSTPAARANPFGSAKPVDAPAAREKEIEDKLARERGGRLKDRSNDASVPSGRFQDRAPQASANPPQDNWRDRRSGPQNTSRPSSASHSRATSNDGAITPPGQNAASGRKQHPAFSFAALASDAPVEGEEEDGDVSANPVPQEVHVD
ncbi:hypothetical protein FRB99_005852 [Tulasnella sp. 403]|nr:hypothetical protein FRB99_005852 [Tulasnella sp. 403]